MMSKLNGTIYRYLQNDIGVDVTLEDTVELTVQIKSLIKNLISESKQYELAPHTVLSVKDLLKEIDKL
jgi:hypothetical protein